ncbi:sushi repeat-containing protein SRPX-like [Ruditapes philippinarum]|uniref:sushi repeat-containing protein SRPX-like n=1 Tax=Ruditapes philippinarum TaxID=129788 RepID=UPI00295BBDBB|nr:sushi repeat-containing protein SRPX-like [Ruditapes philippinarum]
MEATFVCLIFILFLNINILDGETLALKALISRNDCDIKQLLQTPEENITVRCDALEKFGRYIAPNRTFCQVTRNETVFQYHCVEGSWKISKGTDHHLRPKRFFWLIALFVAAVIVATPVVIYCSTTLRCKKEKVSSQTLRAPTYTVCPPPGIQSLYIADRKRKTVQVTWADPIATDDREVISNIQTSGLKSGNQFPGLPKEGYRHYIVYVAKDGHKLTDTCSFTFSVKYLTCNEPATPRYGRKVSCPDGYIYGGECMFECFDGYEMVGSNKATCQQNETWDNAPTCKKVKCNPPFTTTNGIIACDDTNYEFDDDCLITCKDGFKLNGPSKMTCMADKTWSVDSKEVSCIDDDPPVISCQTIQVFYADRSSFNTSVTWIVPHASDNVDENPSILQTSGPRQGDSMPEGFHSVKYKTIDIAGNSFPALSECTIVIEVKDKMLIKFPILHC